MEPETIVVLIMTAAFLGLCIWVERKSRQRHATSNGVEPSEGSLRIDERPKDKGPFPSKRLRS
jgi:hypothetical protein